MKRMICIALSVLLSVCLTACGGDPAPAPKSEQDVLNRVLNSEQSFVVKTWSEGKVEEKTLNRLTFSTEYVALNSFVPAQYAYVDLDRDEVFELVVLDLKMEFFLVLRYTEEQVRGYIIPYRGMRGLRIDGRFQDSEGAGISAINYMSFYGADYTITELAYRNDYDGVYRLDGAVYDKMSVEGYFDSWELMPEVKWTTMED